MTEVSGIQEQLIAPRRIDGDAPLRDYAAIGDGRTIALIALDGSIDWLCLPDLDSSAVFAGLLDAERGGRWALCPVGPFEAARRYVPGTNVLETTFHTSTGTVRVTDAMLLPNNTLGPQRELARVIEGLEGVVDMQWTLDARFGFAQRTTHIEQRGQNAIATSGSLAVALCSFGAGEPEVTDSISGTFELHASERSLLVLSAAHQEPLIFPSQADVESRLSATIANWRKFADGVEYEGPWHDAVVRSALALKLLVFAPSGAIAAAGTTSLPEALGGERNWDYRFCWVRDSAFVLAALLRLGCSAEADAFFWWLMQASQRTHPRLGVLYRLDGGSEATETEVALRGYRNSTPVRVGNGAADQVQLDVYGDLFQAAWYYQAAGRRIDAEVGARLAEIADLVCRIWHEPDAGLWEVRSGPQHFTQSKMMCWIALDRAIKLAETEQIPAAHLGHWRDTAHAVRAFIEDHCWSEEKHSYVRHTGTEELDASLLIGVIFDYGDVQDARLRSTVDAIRTELQHGPFVYRYSGEDGLGGTEGAFLTCSFWLVEALARQHRNQEAAELMDELVGLANDVGLYAEEVDPDTGAFLGNLPQALSHLGLINAAITLRPERQR